VQVGLFGGLICSISNEAFCPISNVPWCELGAGLGQHPQLADLHTEFMIWFAWVRVCDPCHICEIGVSC
jgi:hypothetical protein